jgi:hypothetical protein
MLRFQLTHPGILEILGRLGHGDRTVCNPPGSSRQGPA